MDSGGSTISEYEVLGRQLLELLPPEILKAPIAVRAGPTLEVSVHRRRSFRSLLVREYPRSVVPLLVHDVIEEPDGEKERRVPVMRRIPSASLLRHAGPQAGTRARAGVAASKLSVGLPR